MTLTLPLAPYRPGPSDTQTEGWGRDHLIPAATLYATALPGPLSARTLGPPKPPGGDLITLTLPLYGQALPGPLSARPLGPPDPKGGDVITLTLSLFLCGPATPASFRPSLSPTPQKNLKVGSWSP